MGLLQGSCSHEQHEERIRQNEKEEKGGHLKGGNRQEREARRLAKDVRVERRKKREKVETKMKNET